MAQGTGRTQGGNPSGQQQEMQQQYGQTQHGGQQQQLSPGQQQMGGQQSAGVPAARQGAVARIGRNPLALMDQMMREMDSMFESFFGMPAYRPTFAQRMQNLWIPEIEMREQGNQLRICVDLPGLTKDDVKVEVEDGALIVQGERREERSEGGEAQGFRRSERRYGSFHRTIPLPDYVDTGNAQAQMKDGVLEVTFPTTGRGQGRRLEIKG